MKRFPLLFGYKDLIGGAGFIAVVETRGRALLEEGSDEVWMYGLNPGGIAGGGTTHKEALSDFRTGYQSVLYDLANSAPGFEGFKEEVEKFFRQLNKDLEASWFQAVEAVKAGGLDADWLNKRTFSEDELSVRVSQIKHGSATENSLPQESLAA